LGFDFEIEFPFLGLAAAHAERDANLLSPLGILTWMTEVSSSF
jgi:hypothetical protein